MVCWLLPGRHRLLLLREPSRAGNGELSERVSELYAMGGWLVGWLVDVSSLPGGGGKELRRCRLLREDEMCRLVCV